MPKSSSPPQAEYLGDGVYADFDGYHVVIDLRAQAIGDHVCKICLEPMVAEQLIWYIHRAIPNINLAAIAAAEGGGA